MGCSPRMCRGWGVAYHRPILRYVMAEMKSKETSKNENLDENENENKKQKKK